MRKLLILSVCLSLCLTCADAKMSPTSNRLYNSAILQEQDGNYEQALQYINQALRYSPDDAVLNIKQAGLYQNLGKYENAISAYNKAISLRPDDGFLYLSLANLYMQQYDYNNALLMYEKAQSLMSDYNYNYINIANVKHLLNDDKGAIEAYQKFLEAYPNNLEGLSAIANIYADKEDYDKAIEYYALALRSNPKEFRDYSNYGLALMKKEDYPKAELAFKGAVGVNKNDSVSYANLGVVQMRQDKLDEAKASFEQALKIDSELDALRYDYGALLEAKGMSDKAIEQYNLYIKQYPKTPSAYIKIAQLYEKQNNIGGAIAILEQGLAVTPDNIALKSELARAYQNNSQFEKSLKLYDEILASDKANLVTQYNRAVVKSALGQSQEAEIILNRLLKEEDSVLAKNEIRREDIKNDMIENSIHQAQTLERAGEYKRARAIYSKLLEQTTDNYKVYIGMADTSLALGMDTYAKDYYEKAIQLDNNDANALSKYAEVLYKLKEYDTALAVLEKAIEKDPMDDSFYYNVSLINYDLKNYQKSLDNIKKAISLKSDNDNYYYMKGLILENTNKKDAIFAYEKFIELTGNEKLKSQIQKHVKELYDEVVK